MRIALAQLNPVVGDFKGNSARILEAVRRAEEQGAELVLTPELSLWGYPPRDQLLEPSRIEQQDTALQWLVNQLKSSVTLLVGAALPAADADCRAVRRPALTHTHTQGPRPLCTLHSVHSPRVLP